MLDQEWIADLDGDAACEAVEAAHRRVLQAQAEQLYLAAHWADLHSGEGLEDERRRSGRRTLPGMERVKRVGAVGTPSVAEFAAMELGALQGMSHVAAEHLMRDALNVRHRHPLLWAAVGDGEVRVWQARAVARMCATAGLDRDQAHWVDEATTPYLPSLPWGRFEALVAARIVEVDPGAAEARRLAAAMARFVRTGQSSEYGLKTLVARATAGDVVFFVAMVDRIAQILALRGDPDAVDVRRSKAIGILATPARALVLLQQAEADLAACRAPTSPEDGDADPGEVDPGQDPETVREGDVHPSQNDADDPPEGSAGPSGHPEAFVKPPAVDPRRLLPNATLYVHLCEDSLTRGSGVARLEGVGPVTVEQVIDFLGHTNVRVVPVLDIAGQRPVDCYEAPARMAEAVHLRSPACVSPWGTNLSRRKDLDHVIPYLSPDRGGPPGQTSMDNLAGLSRFAHRAKTHGRWRLRQPSPGVFEWRSPHGYAYRVDRHGTHALGRERPRHARAEPRPVLDIHEPPFALELGDESWHTAS